MGRVMEGRCVLVALQAYLSRQWTRIVESSFSGA